MGAHGTRLFVLQLSQRLHPLVIKGKGPASDVMGSNYVDEAAPSILFKSLCACICVCLNLPGRPLACPVLWGPPPTMTASAKHLLRG